MNGIWSTYEEEAVMQMLRYSFTGGPQKIKAELSGFVSKTGINEIMATSHLYDHAARLRSYELLAEVFAG
jgi:hypothetical protein